MKRRLVVVLIVIFSVMVTGCGLKVTQEPNVVEEGINTYLDAKFHKDKDLYFNDGKVYTVTIGGKKVNADKFYVDPKLGGTLSENNTSNSRIRISKFNENSDKVFAQIEILNDEQLKVPTPYGFLNYPVDMSENVIVNSYNENGFDNYEFVYVVDGDSYPMFLIQFGEMNDSSVFTLVGDSSPSPSIGINIQSVDLSSDNPIPEDSINDFFIHQEMLNYIIDHFEFNDGMQAELVY